MKYMGSKTALLKGNLGRILAEEASDAYRFVDLFCGSGAVAHFVAQTVDLPVLSIDLQEYARILSAAVIERTSSLSGNSVLDSWLEPELVADGGEVSSEPLTAADVYNTRIKARKTSEGFVTRHYGGHYYSLRQARALDRLHASLPTVEPARTVALAALLHAGSVCAAAPGHTAQPFQPTESLLPFIQKTWSRDVSAAVSTALGHLTPMFAQTPGQALVGDARSSVESLREGDLVFCDPPYSAVQYSRFYHVLEGIARGGWDEVSGKGRAPARALRKTSEFSMKSKAPKAMKSLLDGMHTRGCRVIVTFPNTDASNGLSGQDIIAMASENWEIEPHYVDSVHSTLGGSNNGGSRGGRKKLKEVVIVLTPKSSIVSSGVELRLVELGRGATPVAG